MKKYILTTALIFSSLFVSGCTLIQSDRAGLEISTQPQANVFINSDNKGTTPFTTEALKPGEYDIRLESPQGTWSKKIRIENGTVYFININIGQNESSTSGELVYLEKGRGVWIISSPNGAEVSLDGQKQGFTPYLIQNISEGEHQITIAKNGFEPRTININALKGNKIMIEAMLNSLGNSNTMVNDEEDSKKSKPTATPQTSESPSSSPKATTLSSPSPSAKTTSSPTASATTKPSTSTKAKGTVTVLDTSTGWLRVRDKAGLEGKEVARVDSGETIEYIGQTDNGWTQIILKDGTIGFVASRFVKVNN